jgi:hypothetical protein
MVLVLAAFVPEHMPSRDSKSPFEVEACVVIEPGSQLRNFNAVVSRRRRACSLQHRLPA